MAGISIEVDLTSIGFEQDPETGEFYPGPSIEEAIVQAIAARAYSGSNVSEIMRQVQQRVDTVIDEVAKPIILDILTSPIQRHDRYNGDPVGEPTTIREMVIAAVEKYLTQPGSSSMDRNRVNNLGELIDLSVKEALQKELRPTIDEAKKQRLLQDVFLGSVRDAGVSVTMFLVNGVMLQGRIAAYDLFCMLLEREGFVQLAYKHAVSTIQPAAPVDLTGDWDGDSEED